MLLVVDVCFVFCLDADVVVRFVLIVCLFYTWLGLLFGCGCHFGVVYLSVCDWLIVLLVSF